MSNEKPPKYFHGHLGTWERWLELKRLDREADALEKRRGETGKDS